MGKRTKANSNLIDSNNFLKNTIKTHPKNESHVLCMICSPNEKESDWILWESLEGHLRAADHLKKVKSKKRETESQIAADVLRDSKESKKSSFSQVQTSQKSADKNYKESIDQNENPKITQLDKSNAEEYYQFQITNFIIQNNIPFYHAQKISTLIKDINRIHNIDSQANFVCNDTHVTKMSSNAIAPMLKQEYMCQLETKPFSLAIDEASNANVQYLAVNARYFDKDSEKNPITKLISLIKVEDSCTGIAIFNTLKHLLFEGPSGVQRQKLLVGIVTDGATNMISSQGAGTANRLQELAKQIIITHDICHCLNLIMKKCIQDFPNSYVSMTEKICQTFSKSTIKTAQLQGIMSKKSKESSESTVLAIRNFVPTRWSSFTQCL